MAIKTDFEKLEILYTAINDLNKVLENKDSNTRIDDLFNAIKEVDKSEFDSEIQDRIIKSFIDAVTKIYTDESIRLNSSIGLAFTVPPVKSNNRSSIPDGTYSSKSPIANRMEDKIVNEWTANYIANIFQKWFKK